MRSGKRKTVNDLYDRIKRSNKTMRPEYSGNTLSAAEDGDEEDEEDDKEGVNFSVDINNNINQYHAEGEAVEDDEEGGKASKDEKTHYDNLLCDEYLQDSFERLIRKALKVPPKRVSLVEERLHLSVAERWAYWCTNGISVVDKEAFLKKYFRPAIIDTSKLNFDTSQILADVYLKRDRFLMENQPIAGSALVALGLAINDIIERSRNLGMEVAEHIEKLRGVAEMITHIVFSETKSRKTSVFPVTAKRNKKLFKNSNTDELAFEKDVSAAAMEANVSNKIKDRLRNSGKGRIKKTSYSEEHLNYQCLPATIPAYARAGNSNQPKDRQIRKQSSKKKPWSNKRVQNGNSFKTRTKKK